MGCEDNMDNQNNLFIRRALRGEISGPKLSQEQLSYIPLKGFKAFTDPYICPSLRSSVKIMLQVAVSAEDNIKAS